ncbi:helix-turn-helix domain-containing protein [Spirillospora sp. NPDC052269]
MALTYFTTGGLEPRDRLGAWHETSLRVHDIPTLISSPHRNAFDAALSAASLGDVRISRQTHSPLTIRRTGGLIRRRDPERYVLTLIESGIVTVGHQVRSSSAGRGQLLVMDSHRRWRATLTSTDGQRKEQRPPVRHLVMDFPRRALSLPPGLVDDLVAVPFDAQAGIGAILHRHLLQALGQADTCGETDLNVLRDVTLDLVGALLARRLDAESALSPEARQRALTARIHRYIDDNLADPTLSPQRVADAHQISLRFLYKLFQTQETTVAAHIRLRRLDRCRRDLADPGMAHRSVQRIALRWGFSDPSHFSKLFHKTHDLSPADYRIASLRTSGYTESPSPCTP